jgi:hypothetical protein
MLPPMCPRPTKPIFVAVVVAISRPLFDRHDVVLAALDVPRAASAHPAAAPSAALIAAMIAPPRVTDATDRRKLVSKKRQRIQASATSSKAIVTTATSSAARYCGIRNGSVCRIPPRTCRRL